MVVENIEFTTDSIRCCKKFSKKASLSTVSTGEYRMVWFLYRIPVYRSWWWWNDQWFCWQKASKRNRV